LGTVKFLGFEQTFKNALTGLQLGGGKGGANFDPNDHSEGEVMRFCQSFMTELYRHIGPWTDIPAGDQGVGEREIGFLFGQYKRIANRYATGALTGKGVGWGGSLLRTEATGYGLIYFLQRMLDAGSSGLEGREIVVSGAGEVGLHAMAKAVEFGARVVACSDVTGHVVEEKGLDIDLLRQVMQTSGGCLQQYVEQRPDARYFAEGSVWKVPCDVALPCATQNELTEDDARSLIHGGCMVVTEGANMPSTPGAIKILREAGVAFGPSKAANAGGVTVSELEMVQNASRETWEAERVEELLQQTINDIHDTCRDTAIAYGRDGDYIFGANVAAFRRIADATLALGTV
jgi:glutamate dehydrogenase (NADP+)